MNMMKLLLSALLLSAGIIAQAQKYTITRYLVRMVIYAAVIIAAYYTSYLNIPALVIGLFGTKAGAYLQPLMHRFLEWRHEKVSIKNERGE